MLTIMLTSCEKGIDYQDLHSVSNVVLENGVLSFESYNHFLNVAADIEETSEIGDLNFTSLLEYLENIETKDKDDRFEFNKEVKSYEIKLPYLDLLPLLNEDGLVKVGDIILVFKKMSVYSVPSEKYNSIANILNDDYLHTDDRILHSPIIVTNVDETSRVLEGGCWKNINAGLWCEHIPFGYIMFTDNISYQYAVNISIPDSQHRRCLQGCAVWSYRLINRTRYYQYSDPNSLEYNPASDLWYTFDPRINSSVYRSGDYGDAVFVYSKDMDLSSCNQTTGSCDTEFINIMDQATIAVQSPANTSPIPPSYNVNGFTEVSGGMSIPNCFDAPLSCEFQY